MPFPYIPVPRAESHGDAALQRARRRGARLRAGAQVARSGADPVSGQEALQRGDTAGPGAHGVALPEGSPGGRRLSHQPHEVEYRAPEHPNINHTRNAIIIILIIILLCRPIDVWIKSCSAGGPICKQELLFSF